MKLRYLNEIHLHDGGDYDDDDGENNWIIIISRIIKLIIGDADGGKQHINCT